MSEKALRDLNMSSESERKNESSCNGNFAKPCVEHITENLEERQTKTPTALVETTTNGDKIVTSEVEVGNSEVEYIESENLSDVEDVDTSIKV